MINLSVTKNKLIELQESNVSYNIVSTHFEKDSDSLKYRKIYNVIMQNRPLLLQSKEQDLVVLGKLSKYENRESFKIDYDLTGGKISSILQKNDIRLCCSSDEKTYILANKVKRKKLSTGLFCKNCIKSFKVDILDDKLIKSLKDTTRSIANYFPVEIFIASIIEACETGYPSVGWVYDKTDTTNNTPTLAWNSLMKNRLPGESSIEKATEFIAIYNHEVINSSSSEFMISIKLLLDKKFVTYQDINTVSFLYKMVNDKILTQAQCFVGEVGQKFEGLVKLIDRIQTDSQWGLCNIYKFQHNGSNITYMTNNYLDLIIGNTYTLKGKIKEHSLYRETKQTRISNVEIGD